MIEFYGDIVFYFNQGIDKLIDRGCSKRVSPKSNGFRETINLVPNTLLQQVFVHQVFLRWLLF